MKTDFIEGLEYDIKEAKKAETKISNCNRVDTEKIDIMKVSIPKCYNQSINNDLRICALCFDLPSDAVVMECGHGGICFRCGIKLMKMKENCPLCRNSVSLILKIDMVKNYGSFIKIVDYMINTET